MTMPWWRGPLCPFDLESTGVNVWQDRVVTGYVAFILPRLPTTAVEVQAKVLIDPGVEIPQAAYEVHRVSTEKARRDGCTPADGLNSIAAALARAMSARIPVVGMNLCYDFSLLHHDCIRHGVPTVSERLGESAPIAAARVLHPVVDALVLDKAADPYRRGKRKLTDLTAHYGVLFGDAHEAEADAMGAARVAYAVAQRFPEIGDATLADLHTRQIGWKATQAAGLQAHFRKKDSSAWIDPCWPICVDPSHERS